MVKIKRVRTKQCCRCEQSNEVLYRVRTEKDGPWIFLCPECLDLARPGNVHYQYGGTWKSKKRH